MEEAYEGGGAATADEAEAVAVVVVMVVVLPEAPPQPPPVLTTEGAVGAIAVCSTGFCTCVLFTDCIMMGGCVFACLALHPGRGAGLVTVELQLEEMFEVGLGEPADALPE